MLLALDHEADRRCQRPDDQPGGCIPVAPVFRIALFKIQINRALAAIFPEDIIAVPGGEVAPCQADPAAHEFKERPVRIFGRPEGAARDEDPGIDTAVNGRQRAQLIEAALDPDFNRVLPAGG